jgi:hypothetical protein
VIRARGSFFATLVRIDLECPENDADVAFCHYSDARDLCCLLAVATLRSQTLAGD